MAKLTTFFWIFSKAFDKVSHKKLTHKLAQYGISGKSLVWIAAFLQNQTQFTVVNGAHSTTTSVTSGPTEFRPGANPLPIIY